MYISLYSMLKVVTGDCSCKSVFEDESCIVIFVSRAKAPFISFCSHLETTLKINISVYISIRVLRCHSCVCCHAVKSGFQSECPKLFGVCFGFALLRSPIR